MLESEQSEVGETGSLDVSTRDSEDATGLARTIEECWVFEEVVVHGAQCTCTTVGRIRWSLR